MGRSPFATDSGKLTPPGGVQLPEDLRHYQPFGHNRRRGHVSWTKNLDASRLIKSLVTSG
jgi:hypothetical protein